MPHAMFVDDSWPPAEHDDEPVTLCRDCDHVHTDTREKPPFQWRCLKFPAPPQNGFVDPDWRPEPPYHKCEKINVCGACEAFAPRRAPKEAA